MTTPCVNTGRPIQVFYPAHGTNNPGTGDVNFYYYYKQVVGMGDTTYDGQDQSGSGGYVIFHTGSGRWAAFLTANAHHLLNRSTWYYPEYIDRFAWSNRHEVKHVSLESAMWGATTDRNDQEDADGDYLKDAVETNYHRGYDPSTHATYPDQVAYGQSPLLDAEDDCMRYGYTPYYVDILWENGNNNSDDWANPGRQY
jgi:hypothetical protein